MSEPTRRILLACLAFVFLIFGAIVTYWAYGNAVMWYHDTYVEPDVSAAEERAEGSSLHELLLKTVLFNKTIEF